MKKPSLAPPEVRSILDSMRRLVRALRVYSREAEARTGLSAAQLFVLQQLEDGKPVTLRMLSERTMTDPSSASVVVGRLARKGLIRRGRSTADARSLEIQLSPQGRQVLLRRPDVLQERLISAAARLGEAEGKALAAGLRSLLDEAGLATERPQLFFEKEPR